MGHENGVKRKFAWGMLIVPAFLWSPCVAHWLGAPGHGGMPTLTGKIVETVLCVGVSCLTVYAAYMKDHDAKTGS
jgi:hypothetical protein